MLPLLVAAALALPAAASARNLVRVQRELAKLGYTVAAAQSEGAARIALTPNDPYLAAGFGWSLARTQLPDAWSVTTGAPQTMIAVLDTGVDPATADLAGALVPGANFVTADGSTADDNGHGTEVASLIAARIGNGTGIAGVCGSCSIMPVKVMGSDGTGYWSTVAAGVVWATDHGAKVVNLSIAGPIGEDVLQRAIEYAQAYDVVVVAAAGNDHLGQPAYPAAYPGVVSVEATDENDNLYSFSNYGPAVTLAAPGCVATIGLGNALVGGCGTSFASPIVAGIAGLVRSNQPTFGAAQVIGALESGAERVGNVDSAYGRLNAYRALTGTSPPVAVGKRSSTAAAPRRTPRRRPHRARS
ncbi:MAG TPA: S8 family serine peptidase [Gaiellaceae bacterium]